MCSQGISQIYLHNHTFIRNRNEPYLPSLPTVSRVLQVLFVCAKFRCNCILRIRWRRWPRAPSVNAWFTSYRAQPEIIANVKTQHCTYCVGIPQCRITTMGRRHTEEMGAASPQKNKTIGFTYRNVEKKTRCLLKQRMMEVVVATGLLEL